MHGSDNLCYKQAQAVYDQVCTRYVVNSSRLRLQSTALKAVGIVNLLLKFFKTVTDIHLKQVTVQQQMKEIHFWRQKCVCFKTPQCIRTSTSRTTRTLFVPIKLLGDCKEFDLWIFSLHYYMVFARSALKGIWPFVYTFSMNLADLGIQNVLWSVESLFKSNFRDLFKCRSAKFTVLHVQHTRTQKKRFLCLKFGARISELPSKYGKALSIASEFVDARLCSFCNK